MSPFLYKTNQRTPALFLQSPFLAHTSNDDRNWDANKQAQSFESFEAEKRKIKSASVVYENKHILDPIRDNLSYISVLNHKHPKRMQTNSRNILPIFTTQATYQSLSKGPDQFTYDLLTVLCVDTG